MFHAVGSTSSIRSAAAELGVSHTAVARHIKELEGWFGTRLVETTAHGTALNAEGRRLHDSVNDAFELIAQATAEIRPPGQSMELRVWSAAGFATYWILPRLQALQRLLPRVAISLLPTEQPPSFGKGEVDVEVRYGTRDEEGLVNLEVVRPRILALASRRWVAEHPQIRTPADLVGVELLHERRRDDWTEWFTALGVPFRTLSGPRLGILPAVLEAVHRDQGPGLFPEPLADEHLLRNNLVPVLADAPRLRPYVLVFHRSRADDPVIGCFSKWLKDSLEAFQ